MKIMKLMRMGSVAALFLVFLVSGVMAADPASEGETEKEVQKNSFMIYRIEGSLPSDPWDASWDAIEVFKLPITGQAAIQPRLYGSSAKEARIRAVHNDNQIVIMMEYDDTSKDIDLKGKTDAAAVMFPVEPLPMRAHIYMGEPMLQVEGTYVNIWHWKAKDNKGVDLKGEGIVNPPTPHESQDITANGVWKDNKWRIMFSRAMQTSDKHDAVFVPTQFANVAFATWDARKNETKSMHGMSSWYYLIPEAAPDNSIYLYGLMGAFIAGIVEFAFVKSIQKKKSES